ncbi:MAG: LysR family transcriptional regulator [archaeon]|nr:LysR family transcriptional regulator [archaeon]
MTFNSKGLINLKINDNIYDYKLYESLESLSKTSSQRKTAKKLGISHAVLNRRILKAEEKSGLKLVEKIGKGSVLTSDGIKLLNEFRKYNQRISETEEITIGGGHIVSGLLKGVNPPHEMTIYSSNDNNAYKLAKRGVIDILALDDPLLAFTKDLNFIPIAYDYLVLISNNKASPINDLNDLNNLKYVSVKGSAQRLAFNSLEHYNIPYEIVAEVDSQFDAFKMVKNSEDLHSFLNASYFNENNILQYDTRHVISLVKINEDKKEVNDFIEYLLNEGQKLIIKEGFMPINR